MSLFIREWVKVGRLMTKIVSYGGSVETKPKKLVLILPGNPGIASYYEEFMETLYSKTGEKIPIWAIGHAGHDVAGQEESIPSRLVNRDLFSLEGQIRHKLDFIDEFVPSDCELILIGHSIGCKIILEILKHFDSNKEKRTGQIRAGYLLFPTIERMYESPKGYSAWWQTAYLAPIIIALAWLLKTILPKSGLQSIIRLVLSFGSGNRLNTENSERKPDMHPCILSATSDLINPTSVGNVLYMAYTELIQVRELDDECVRRFGKKLRFYFGANDHWCPVNYYHEMMEKIPNASAQLCKRNIPHAFVLGYSVETALEVAEWFKTDNLL